MHTYELGLSCSTIGRQRSAISAIVEIPGDPQLGEHWLVSLFMKGVFHLRHPQPRYTKILDVNKVLSYLKRLGPNGSFSLKQLKFKISVLLTILAGRRTHTLDMLSVVHMDQSHDNVIFHIIGLTTCSSPSRPNRSVVYRTYMENEYFVQLNVFMHTWRSEIVTQDFTEVFIT